MSQKKKTYNMIDEKYLQMAYKYKENIFKINK